MNDPPEMTQEEQLRSIGLMLESLGQVLRSSAGDAERDCQIWLADCKQRKIPGSDDQLRHWYRSVLGASGVTDNR